MIKKIFHKSFLIAITMSIGSPLKSTSYIQKKSCYAAKKDDDLDILCSLNLIKRGSR